MVYSLLRFPHLPLAINKDCSKASFLVTIDRKIFLGSNYSGGGKKSSTIVTLPIGSAGSGMVLFIKLVIIQQKPYCERSSAKLTIIDSYC
jgi:hypothetical protein